MNSYYAGTGFFPFVYLWKSNVEVTMSKLRKLRFKTNAWFRIFIKQEKKGRDNMNNHYSGIIPEGSTVKIKVSGDFIDLTLEAVEDMTIERNSLMLLSGGLGTPISVEVVEKINNSEFIIHSYLQDCFVAKNDRLFQSISDV